jgi:ATP-dependent Clp protease ATP-binding subunit ClpA
MRMTAHAQTILNFSRQEAARLSAPALTSAHLMLSLLDAPEPGIGQTILAGLGVDLDVLAAAVEQDCVRGSAPVMPHSVEMGQTIPRVLQQAAREAESLGCAFVSSEHLLLAVLSLQDDPTAETLREAGVTAQRVRREAQRLLGLDEEPDASRTPRDRTTRATKPVRLRSDDSQRLENVPFVRRLEPLLSQMALWSKNPDILKRFAQLNRLLGEATNAAVSELSALDLPEEIVQPAIDVFTLTQEKAQAITLSDFARAAELHAQVEGIIAAQAALPAEQARLANELIDVERQKQAAVAQERYEQAAECRDRSRKLRRRWESLRAGQRKDAAE